MTDGNPIATDRARQTIASYPDYAQAQSAVDYLSDQKFAVQHLSIVGEGLRLVEQVTGRKGYGSAALSGAVSGAATGALLGFVLGLLSLINPVASALVVAFYGLLIGAVLGAVFGLVGHMATGGRRDFSSVGGMQAERYDVLADASVAEEARRLLAERR